METQLTSSIEAASKPYGEENPSHYNLVGCGMNKTTKLLVNAFGIQKKDVTIAGPCSRICTGEGTAAQWRFLESEGFVTRNPSILGHAFNYSITAKGTEAFKQATEQ